MKSKTVYKHFGMLFTAILTMALLAPAHADENTCSLAKSSGKWSFTDQGTVVGIGPRTAMGILTLDGKGSLQNGVATSSLNGAIASETFSGTYTVNSDCTGTISVNIFASGIEIFTVSLNIAFDNDMKHMRGIFTSVVTPNGAQLTTVINLDGRKQ